MDWEKVAETIIDCVKQAFNLDMIKGDQENDILFLFNLIN
jgi:hypothetical protein